MRDARKLVRLHECSEVCDRGAKDKILWAIPEDAAFIIAWRDPIDNSITSMTSDDISSEQFDHLVMCLLRRAIKNV